MLDTPSPEQVTVEAPTVEDALVEISAQFGEEAEIMRAQKVHRGGLGGFFAKEMVQLTARRRDSAPAPLRLQDRARARTQTGPQGGGIADVLERMARNADAEDSDFRTVLQRELASSEGNLAPALPEETAARETAVGETEVEETAVEETAVEETEAAPEPEPAGVRAPIDGAEYHFVPPFAEEMPEPVTVGPVLRAIAEPRLLEDDPEPEHVKPSSEVLQFPTLENPNDAAVAAAMDANIEDLAQWWRHAEAVDAPEGMGPIAWSTTSMLRIGLPAPILSAVADLDGNDDMGWINAIAAAVAPYCGALPQGNIIVVGPHAERLAEPLGLPLIRSGDMAPYDGSFCAMVEDSSEDRKWLEFVRGGRGIHLVIGDEPWHDLLVGEPVAVSWVGEGAVGDALYLAFTLGATLGFGTVDGFVSSMVRAQPTDVALAVRRIVGRR